jgi:hypothetical protein
MAHLFPNLAILFLLYPILSAGPGLIKFGLALQMQKRACLFPDRVPM